MLQSLPFIFCSSDQNLPQDQWFHPHQSLHQVSLIIYCQIMNQFKILVDSFPLFLHHCPFKINPDPFDQSLIVKNILEVDLYPFFIVKKYSSQILYLYIFCFFIMTSDIKLENLGFNNLSSYPSEYLFSKSATSAGASYLQYQNPHYFTFHLIFFQ